MAVEINILSGVRQGQRLVLDATKLRAGPDPNCEIYFDPLADNAARDRSVALSLMDDGWYIQSTGPGEVFVNQNSVVGLTRLKSGAIVRMSEFGPEFEFRILARAPSPVPQPVATPGYTAIEVSPVVPAMSTPSPPVPTPVSPPLVLAQEPPRPVAPAPATRDSGRLAVMVGFGVLACLMLLVLVKLMSTPAPSVVVVPGPATPNPSPSPAPAATTGDVSTSTPKPPAPAGDPLLAQLAGGVLLIQVEKSGQFWPFATCCAVSENTVFTSAREALKLGAWINDPGSGFKGWVTNPATGLKLPVQNTRLYAVSVSSPEKEKPTDWLYTNLGLVTVHGTLPKTVEFASPEELAQLAPGKAVHAYSYVHEGDLITPEDHFEPRGTPGKILFINAHPEFPGKPRVLGVKADWPKFPHGSPLVNAQGKVVAVYSDPVAEVTGEAQGAPGAQNVHYATVVNPGVIDLWLKKSDSSVWISTAELKLPAPDPKPPATDPKPPATEPNAPLRPGIKRSNKSVGLDSPHEEAPISPRGTVSHSG